MSCLNNCNCGQCCEPVQPSLPATPPVCIGTQCEETYNSECVLYNGTSLPCANITTGDSVNDIIVNMANVLCNIQVCQSPIKFFLDRLSSYYYIAKVYHPEITLGQVYDNLFITGNGIVTNKASYCSPDGFAYALCFTSAQSSYFLQFYEPKDYIIPVQFHESKFAEYVNTFLSLFDTSLDSTISPSLTANSIIEHGGFNGNSPIKELSILLPTLFTKPEITSLIQMMNTDSESNLVILSDSKNGNLFIGSQKTAIEYVNKFIEI